jgi:hypothetical protein
VREMAARTTHTISRTRPSSRFRALTRVSPLYLTWSFERLQSNPIGVNKESVTTAGTGFSRHQRTIAPSLAFRAGLAAISAEFPV